MNQLVIDDWEQFNKDIEKIFAKCKKNVKGESASYIPELAKVEPNLFGVSICTINGQMLNLGDVETDFSIQSTSKAFT